MTDDLGLLDDLYHQFCQNTDLMKLLGNPQTPQARNDRIRRELTPLSYATTNNVNFISIYLSSATETENIYVVRAYLHVEYYTKSREDLAKIKRLVTEILRDNGYFATSMYNLPSETKGIYRYIQSFRPLIFA